MKIKILFDLFIVFFQIGMFTFGGGYAMVPLMCEQVVAKGWLTNSEVLDFIAVSESTPGSFAINTATFIGYSQGGVSGAIVATISCVLPPLIIIMIISSFIHKFLKNKYVKYTLNGIKAVVIGLIFGFVLTLAYESIFPQGLNIQTIDYRSIIIMIIIFTLTKIKKRKFSPIALILISAILGYIFYGLIPMI